jgi:preprotein translocase subunit SecF
MRMNFVKYKKIYFVFTGILIAAGSASILFFGLNQGIDFTGGSIMEVSYNAERPSNQEIRQIISGLDLGEVSLQPTGNSGLILRMKSIDVGTHEEIIQRLGDVREERFESIGPTIGKELKQKTAYIIVFSILAMVVYIAIAFRKVSYPVRSWQYGMVTLLILFHDVLITVAVFSALGKFYNIQFTIPVVVALLTVVGYAINNVVVVFDRIRENLLRRTALFFSDTINNAINQTLTRQINTSLTTLLPLLFIYFMGGETLKYFVLALMVGIISGLYSSILLAGPILVSWLGRTKK